MKEKASSIFRNGSKTYYYSSLFFPAKVKQQIFTLYAFVRVADDYVDKPKPNETAYYSLKKSYQQALAGNLVNNDVAADFAKLVKIVHLNPKQVEAFFTSMEMDLAKTPYHTYSDLLVYMYGSAEVIGLMMARILNLPDQAAHSAQMLGRAMQYINFIRDVDEDNRLERKYFPVENLSRYGINSLQYSEIKQHLPEFKRFIREQISLYREWQLEAEVGFKYIPKRYLIPIKTASEMYKWTARIIYEDPLIIYTKKVKPTRIQVLSRALINTITLG